MHDGHMPTLCVLCVSVELQGAQLAMLPLLPHSLELSAPVTV